MRTRSAPVRGAGIGHPPAGGHIDVNQSLPGRMEGLAIRNRKEPQHIRENIKFNDGSTDVDPKSIKLIQNLVNNQKLDSSAVTVASQQHSLVPRLKASPQQYSSVFNFFYVYHLLVNGILFPLQCFLIVVKKLLTFLPLQSFLSVYCVVKKLLTSKSCLASMWCTATHVKNQSEPSRSVWSAE